MLLMETDLEVVQFALERLNAIVDEFWYELSTQLVLIEELFESGDLPEPVRHQAALVASKVYFHLGEYDDSIHFALAAGNLFNPKERTLYADTILAAAIDNYIANRVNPQADKTNDPTPRDTLLPTLAAAWQRRTKGTSTSRTSLD